MKFKTKKGKHSIYGSKFNVSKLCVRSDRNTSMNHTGSKKHKDFVPKKTNAKSKENRVSNVHIIKCRSNIFQKIFNKHASLYE
jgi:hypothetical protein